IPKKNSADISLMYAPTEKIECGGKLILTNGFTKETYEYKLLGKVDDPLAEGNIVINCKTKTEVREKLVLENNSDRDITYNVDTDLGDIIRGVRSFVVRSGSSYTYEIIIAPL